MTPSYLAGYTDDWAVRPGQVVAARLTASEELTAELDLVRLATGRDPEGEGLHDVVQALGAFTVRPQHTSIGSCVRVENLDPLGAGTPLTASAVVMPTRPNRDQVILSHGSATDGWSIGLDALGRPVARVIGGGVTHEVRGPAPLVAGAWYLVAAGPTTHGRLRVVAAPLAPGPAWCTGPSSTVTASEGSATAPPLRVVGGGRLFVAAAPDRRDGWRACFDGKLEAPALHAMPLTETLLHDLFGGDRAAAAVVWDLGVGDEPPQTIGPTVPGLTRNGTPLDGQVLNSPTRAVTSHGWRGIEQDVRRAPEEYAAIHFHADDLDDCQWECTAAVEVPDDLPSGVYAVRARAGDLVEHLPLFLRPRRPTSDTVVVVPTASYLAYANDHPVSDGDLCEAVAGRTPVVLPTDMLLHEHREWGLSCYDHHADGSGVVHSSRRRPIMNMRPQHHYHVGPWQFPADLALLSWVAREGVAVDIVTDEALDQEGAAALEGYRVVITGTHPEYTSTQMLDAYETWIDRGGRLLYIGANGFYWRAAFDLARPWVLEVRRGQAGSRAWESGPGETHLQATGELGGLWRHLGRPPQRAFGVGYAAQGFDRCGWYERLDDSDDERAAFVFEGFPARTFGHAGTIGGGAAGQELDRYDAALGTPADALLLATSAGLSEGYHRCVEELGFTVAGTTPRDDARVRGDVVYHVRPGGGAIFATGSIAWSGALGLDDGVTTITRNVIRRFRDPAPLEW